MGKSKKKGSKSKKGMGYVVALLGVFLALPAWAGDIKFGFSDEKYALSYMASVNMNTTSTEGRGGGMNAVIGPLATIKAGENTVMALTFSAGVVLGAGSSGSGQTFDGSVGIGPCWMNQIACTHWGNRVDAKTGTREGEFKVMIDLMPLLNAGSSAIGL